MPVPNSSQLLLLVIQTDVTNRVRLEERVTQALEAEHQVSAGLQPCCFIIMCSDSYQSCFVCLCLRRQLSIVFCLSVFEKQLSIMLCLSVMCTKARVPLR